MICYVTVGKISSWIREVADKYGSATEPITVNLALLISHSSTQQIKKKDIDTIPWSHTNKEKLFSLHFKLSYLLPCILCRSDNNTLLQCALHCLMYLYHKHTDLWNTSLLKQQATLRNTSHLKQGSPEDISAMRNAIIYSSQSTQLSEPPVLCSTIFAD